MDEELEELRARWLRAESERFDVRVRLTRLLGTTEPITPAPSVEPLVSAADAGHALGVSAATVTRMAERGEIPRVKVSESWRYDVDACRAALEAATPAHEQKSNEEPAPGGVVLLSKTGS